MSESVAEVYIPNKSIVGSWAAVFEELDAEGNPDENSYVHVIPRYGRHHQISFECWCNPKRSDEPGGNGLNYYVHNPEN
jgi:hypothetical protein